MIDGCRAREDPQEQRMRVRKSYLPHTLPQMSLPHRGRKGRLGSVSALFTMARWSVEKHQGKKDERVTIKGKVI
jgi:hypothetical protein